MIPEQLYLTSFDYRSLQNPVRSAQLVETEVSRAGDIVRLELAPCIPTFRDRHHISEPRYYAQSRHGDPLRPICASPVFVNLHCLYREIDISGVRGMLSGKTAIGSGVLYRSFLDAESRTISRRPSLSGAGRVGSLRKRVMIEADKLLGSALPLEPVSDDYSEQYNDLLADRIDAFPDLDACAELWRIRYQRAKCTRVSVRLELRNGDLADAISCVRGITLAMFSHSTWIDAVEIPF